MPTRHLLELGNEPKTPTYVQAKQLAPVWLFSLQKIDRILRNSALWSLGMENKGLHYNQRDVFEVQKDFGLVARRSIECDQTNMATYELPYAEQHLPELFQEARNGEEVIIVRMDGLSCQLLPMASVIEEEPIAASTVFQMPELGGELVPA